MTDRIERDESSAARVERWMELAERLARLEALGDQGVVSVVSVKVDGERDRNKFTVILSGPPLRDAHYRRDGADLAALLDDAYAHADTVFRTAKPAR